MARRRGGSGGVVEAGGKAGGGGKGGSIEERGAAGEAAGRPAADNSDDSGCSCSTVPATKSRGAALPGIGLAMIGLSAVAATSVEKQPLNAGATRRARPG